MCIKWPVSDVNDINIIFFIYWPLFIQAKNIIETQGLIYKRDLFWGAGGGHYRKLQTNKAYRHEGTLYIEVWHIEACIERLLSYPCRILNQSSYFCTWDLYAFQTKFSEHQWTALFGNWDPPPQKKILLTLMQYSLLHRVAVWPFCPVWRLSSCRPHSAHTIWATVCFGGGAVKPEN